MKKIKFLLKVKDKETKEIYEEGTIKEFEDDRAKEILKAKSKKTKKKIAEEVATESDNKDNEPKETVKVKDEKNKVITDSGKGNDI